MLVYYYYHLCSDYDLTCGAQWFSMLSAVLLLCIVQFLFCTQCSPFPSFSSPFVMTKHPFHLVSPSPWPILTSFSALLFVSGLVFSFSSSGPFLLSLGFVLLAMSCLFWWSNVVRESSTLGFHTIRVQLGLRLGMGLFIVSEVFFFLGFFWAYLHCSLSPNVELGSC